MRAIKFRGKCVPDSKFACKWVIGGYVAPEFDSKKQEEGLIISYYGGNSTFTCHVKPETVGQFTGLLDKNGKEIYEGDIIKHPYVDPIFRDLVEPKEGDGVTSEVVFHDGAFVVKYDENDFIYLDAFTRHGYVEVIGNIHDTTELLRTNNNK